MILIGLGANLPSPDFGPPPATLEAAIAALGAEGVAVSARSAWYRSGPVPPSDQPPFVNGVTAVDTRHPPDGLLALLLEIERRFGRRRAVPGGPRVLDLDLLAYGEIVTAPTAHPALPHPRMHERAFVLLPLAEIAPEWRHPATGTPLARLIEALPPGQWAHPIAAASAAP